MVDVLPWVYWVVLVLLGVLGWFANLLGLPGLWLIVAATAGYAWVTGFGVFVGWPVLGALVALGLVAEVVEFIAGAAGSKAAGGSKRGALAAIVGGVVGGIVGSVAIPVPIVGTLVGLCAGSFAGAFGVELAVVGRTRGDATRIGMGAAKGRLFGTIAKSAIGAVMLGVATIFAIPVGATVPTPATAAPLPATTNPSTRPVSDIDGPSTTTAPALP